MPDRPQRSSILPVVVRRTLVACAVVLVAGGVAGCGSTRQATLRPSGAGVVPAPEKLTGCTQAQAAAARLSPPHRVVTVPGPPGLPSTPVAAVTDGGWAFVTEMAGYQPHTGLVSVLRLTATTARVVRTVTVPGTPFGAALADNARLLVVANYAGGLDLLDTHTLEVGHPDPVTGALASPGGGDAEVAVDGDYAFVTEENSADVAVYHLDRPAPSTSTVRRPPGHLVGTVPVGSRPVGVAFDHHTHTLYVVSQDGGPSGQGELTAINTTLAEHHPATAVIGAVPAGCDPVRVALSPHRPLAWVTDRGADSVLAFRLDPHQGTPATLVGAARVGPAPVGITLVDNGAVALVADSNRFAQPEQNQTLAALDTADLLAQRPSPIGYLPAGAFPRQFSPNPTRAVLFTNFDSLTVGILPPSDLSWLAHQQPTR